MEETLRQILNNLNTVHVHGRDNLNYLLGAIQALEQVIDSMAEEVPSDGGCPD